MHEDILSLHSRLQQQALYKHIQQCFILNGKLPQHSHNTSCFSYRLNGNKIYLKSKSIIKHITHHGSQLRQGHLEEKGRAEKKTKIRPLHLTEKELKQRLITLKNYSIWKKAEAKRIDCKELIGDQTSPIIHTVASYGSRYGKNQAFIEFIQNEEQKSIKSEEGMQRFGSQKGRGWKKSITRDKPSFISYKTDEKEKEKIQNDQSSAHKEGNHINIRKRRSRTQPRLNQGQTERKASPYARELAKLKKKLRILPSLVQRNKTEPTEINPQKQNPTISFASKQLQPIRHITQGRYSKQTNNSFIYDDSQTNLSNYLKNIHTILNKSSELLNGCIPEPDIQVSNNSFNSLYRSKRCQFQSFPTENKQRQLSYQPKYVKYSIKTLMRPNSSKSSRNATRQTAKA